MSWLYAVFSVQATSTLIGVAEIAAGIMIALRPWSAKACVLGSLMAIATFVITLTFLFSTPGWEPRSAAFRRSRWRPASSSSRTRCCSASRSGRWARPCATSPTDHLKNSGGRAGCGTRPPPLLSPGPRP